MESVNKDYLDKVVEGGYWVLLSKSVFPSTKGRLGEIYNCDKEGMTNFKCTHCKIEDTNFGTILAKTGHS